MNLIGLLILIIGMTFGSCTQNAMAATRTERKMEDIEISDKSKERDEIRTLIRQVLIFSDIRKSFHLLPVIRDSKDSLYIGFDLVKHKQNLEKLQLTGFFTSEFIENYNQIILTFDKRLRNGDEEWLDGYLPPFNFSSDVNPWCMCQDHGDWNTVEVRIISLDDEKGELEWYWGNLRADAHISWKEFRYNFRVKKESNQWKISYLEGFDFERSTKKVGQQ